MNRSDRAKQFMPFDTLKGLHEALRMKEYEHDRIQKGDLSEEKVREISELLLSIKKGQKGQVVFFEDGHYKNISGCFTLCLELQQIKVNNKIINLNDVFDVVLIN